MALPRMASIGLIAVAMGAVATGALRSQHDQGAIVAKSAERQMPGSACPPAKNGGGTGSDTVPANAYLSCQAYFQSYWPNADWAAVLRSAGR